MTTFDDFKKEVYEKVRPYATSEGLKYDDSVNVAGITRVAGPYQVLEVKLTFTKNRYLNHSFAYVYDADDKCFVKAKVTSKKVTPHKRQPKKPVTLENYKFYSETLRLVGIHKAPDPVYVNVGGTSPSGVIFRGHHFTQEQHDEMMRLCAEGVSFEDAAAKSKAA